jgi:hypothetical protein
MIIRFLEPDEFGLHIKWIFYKFTRNALTFLAKNICIKQWKLFILFCIVRFRDLLYYFMVGDGSEVKDLLSLLSSVKNLKGLTM